MNDDIIHDLKTERQNVSSGLPTSYKIVPLAFYFVSLAAVALSLYFYMSKKAYHAVQDEMYQRTTQAKSTEASHIASQKSIVEEAEKAEVYAKWLEGSRPLQPVTVAVSRSMTKDSSIAELSLTRNPEIPAHTLMELKIDGGGSTQLEETLDAIYALNYQTYSAQQVKGHKSTDFQGTLIHAEN